MRNILLTGGSGAVGQEVLLQLCSLRDDLKITVFDKKSRASEAFYRKIKVPIRLIYGDISIKEEICHACRDQDIVIHLAAVIPPLADRRPDLAEAVNVNGTRNLIESLEKSSPKAFLIYSSSVSVYGDRLKDPWIKTTDNLSPSDRDEYARTKIKAEKLIQQSRIRWAIFRLTAIMGADNHKPSPLMFHMPLDTCIEIATPADTGRAFINALDHIDEIEGRIFNLSGGEKCRILYRDLLSRSFEIMGLGPLDFAEGAFADRNFHCGYYSDADILENIIKFRHDTIDDYFALVRTSVSATKKIAAVLLRRLIKKSLENKSEPLAALKSRNESDMSHFFTRPAISYLIRE